MPSLTQQLNQLFASAIKECFGDVEMPMTSFVSKSRRPEFGDYQANFALPLAKIIKQKPCDCAQAVVDHLSSQANFISLDIAGPGFVNIAVDRKKLSELCQEMLTAPSLGIEKIENPQTIVVDYSSANVAKEMHVGHLRSTVIGDAITRLLTFLGHNVIRQNHLGDWGTQFGMIIQYMLDNDWESSADHSMAEINTLYKKAKKCFDDDEVFARQARERVVALQAGDPQTLEIWQGLVNQSIDYFQTVYERLNVLLRSEDVRGESSYNAQLPEVVMALEDAGVLTMSQGAAVVFLDDFIDPEDKPLPMIVRKSDGGYLYATTDIAAARYRLNELHADRIIYVTDARQKQHFAMLFALVKKCQWQKQTSLEHVAFGSILGPDKKPYKTREGEVVNLSTLLDEAEQKALTIVAEKQPELTSEAQEHIAKTISIGAIKYADLSTDRIKDVIFNWDKMLSFEGNTAPYLQNAYVRIQSIFRKADAQSLQWHEASILVQDEHEHALAVMLLSLPDVCNAVAEDLNCHRLCHYCYEVAQHFHRFYEHCSVMGAATPALQQSRLQLCELTAAVLKQALSLLGIDVLEKM